MQRTNVVATEETAIVGAEIHRIHLPPPRACQAKTAEVLKRKSAKKNRATRATGCSCQNSKSTVPLEPVRACPRIVQTQNTKQPQVNNTRARSKLWLYWVRIPCSSYSVSTNIQLSKTAIPPTAESPQSENNASRWKSECPEITR